MIGADVRLGWTFDALDASIARYNDARGARPTEAFAAAAEAALWSAALNDYFCKRHPRHEEYRALRDSVDDGRTVRALAVYRNRIVHFLEVPHEGTRPGFSDEFGPEFVKYSHHFLALDEVSFDDVEGEPHRNEDAEKMYAHHVAGVEIREVLERVERWWARCRSEFVHRATETAN